MCKMPILLCTILFHESLLINFDSTETIKLSTKLCGMINEYVTTINYSYRNDIKSFVQVI